MAKSRWDAYKEGAFTIPANDAFGFERVDTDDGSVAFRWTVPAEYCNSAGNLQGGVMAAFADAVLGGAAATALRPEQYPALAEMKLSIFRPAPADTKLRGVGRVLKAGARVVFVEAEITDADGRLVAKASGTEIPADA